MLRRRPLLRAAAVGGGAYAAGRHMANKSAEQSQQEAEQNERLADLEQQQAPARRLRPRPQAAPAAPASSMIDQLNQLAALHEQGALTDAEFTAAKARLLGS